MYSYTGTALRTKSSRALTMSTEETHIQNMDLILRKPNESDWSAIEQLLSEMPDAFTLEGQKMFLQDARNLHSMLAEVNGRTVGVIVWICTSSEIEVLWIAVRSAFRRLGIGNALMEEVLKSVEEQRVFVVKTADYSRLPPRSGLTSENFQNTIQFFRYFELEVAARVPDFWGAESPTVIFVRRLWRSKNGC